jgi:hypothetical protein
MNYVCPKLNVALEKVAPRVARNPEALFKALSPTSYVLHC